jgi:hypothetical protein
VCSSSSNSLRSPPRQLHVYNLFPYNYFFPASVLLFCKELLGGILIPVNGLLPGGYAYKQLSAGLLYVAYFVRVLGKTFFRM